MTLVKANFDTSLDCALKLDKNDNLAPYRDLFHMPEGVDNKDCLYFTGNSLGLQPKTAKDYINAELEDWAKLGVHGHFSARHAWLPYHEFLTAQTARLVGAKESEVVVMNSLTVNLHLMLVSFYRPTKERYKIIVESGAFPSDQYAVASQVEFHGFCPDTSVVELKPRPGEETLRTQDIVATIEKEGDTVALVLLGNVNYLTGQAFDVAALCQASQKVGAKFGLNLAHGAGNLLLKLHEWNVDFAVWCSYKYLNAGPGGIAGCFVHERHADAYDLPRFAGWWGHNKKERFKMGPQFDPIYGAEGWQLSNPPIFQLASLRASLEIFDKVGMEALRAKSLLLTGYLEYLIEQLACSTSQSVTLNDQYRATKVKIVTPKNPEERGCQLSLRISGQGKSFLKDLEASGVVCDFREPDIIRVAPVPLYNKFSDVFYFVETLSELLRVQGSK